MSLTMAIMLKSLSCLFGLCQELFSLPLQPEGDLAEGGAGGLHQDPGTPDTPPGACSHGAFRRGPEGLTPTLGHPPATPVLPASAQGRRLRLHRGRPGGREEGLKLELHQLVRGHGSIDGEVGGREGEDVGGEAHGEAPGAAAHAEGPRQGLRVDIQVAPGPTLDTALYLNWGSTFYDKIAI